MARICILRRTRNETAGLGGRQAAQSAVRNRYGSIVPEWNFSLPTLLPKVHFTTASDTPKLPRATVSFLAHVESCIHDSRFDVSRAALVPYSATKENSGYLKLTNSWNFL
jgi:hypothetical protein